MCQVRLAGLPCRIKTVIYEEVAKTLDDLLTEFNPVFYDIEFMVGMSRGGSLPVMVISMTMAKPLVAAYIDE